MSYFKHKPNHRWLLCLSLVSLFTWADDNHWNKQIMSQQSHELKTHSSKQGELIQETELGDGQWYFNNENYHNFPMHPSAVVAKQMISTNTLEVTIAVKTSAEFRFQAGDYVAVYFDTRAKEHVMGRNYSIVSTPQEHQETGNIRIAISLVEGGEASDMFQRIEAGGSLLLLNPRSKLRLSLAEPYQRIILLGTGTGVVPYISMLPELATMDHKEVHILAGFRSVDEAIYQQELAVAGDHEHITVQQSFSREAPEWGLSGYIQMHLPELQLSPATDIIYACGNPQMLETVEEQLTEQGFEKDKSLITESYGFSEGKKPADRITDIPLYRSDD